MLAIVCHARDVAAADTMSRYVWLTGSTFSGSQERFCLVSSISSFITFTAFLFISASSRPSNDVPVKVRFFSFLTSHPYHSYAYSMISDFYIVIDLFIVGIVSFRLIFIHLRRMREIRNVTLFLSVFELSHMLRMLPHTGVPGGVIPRCCFCLSFQSPSGDARVSLLQVTQEPGFGSAI